ATGTYPVQMIVYGNSGCSDTITKQVTVVVYSQPVAAINAPAVACANVPVQFSSNIQSADAINIIQWNLSNGVTSAAANFSYAFTQAGNYTVQLITGTANGCYDTVQTSILVNPSPTVAAGNDMNLCRGSSAPLNAVGTG